MLRAALMSLICVGILGLASAQADEAKKADAAKKEPAKAKIVKVSPKKDAITVKMKDKDGKETEKTFKLAEDIEYLDSTGKVAVIDVFKSGDEVLVVEAEGKLKKLKKDPDAKDKTNKPEAK